MSSDRGTSAEEAKFDEPYPRLELLYLVYQTVKELDELRAATSLQAPVPDLIRPAVFDLTLQAKLALLFIIYLHPLA